MGHARNRWNCENVAKPCPGGLIPARIVREIEKDGVGLQQSARAVLIEKESVISAHQRECVRPWVARVEAATLSQSHECAGGR